jgi:hypothetical protein
VSDVDDLVAFLRARFNEDVEVARQAALAVGDTGYERGELVREPAQHGDALIADGQHWGARYHQVVREQSRGPERAGVVAEAAAFGGRPVAAHIVRHDPARVLVEVEAKRRIVDMYLPPGVSPHPGPCVNFEGQDPAGYDEHDSCARHLAASGHRFRTDYVLRLLALPYVDHPDYREEWRPAE